MCRGKYEIWWVIRSGPIYVIQSIKNIYVNMPACIDN